MCVYAVVPGVPVVVADDDLVADLAVVVLLIVVSCAVAFVRFVLIILPTAAVCVLVPAVIFGVVVVDDPVEAFLWFGVVVLPWDIILCVVLQ